MPIESTGSFQIAAPVTANYFHIVGVHIELPLNAPPVLLVDCFAGNKDESGLVTPVRAWTERVPDADILTLFFAPPSAQTLYGSVKAALYGYMAEKEIFPAIS